MKTPGPSSGEALRRMQRQRRRDTLPELELRRALHRMGLRFWVDRAPVPGLRSRADIVFPKARVAVFVDGCFWHSCPVHGTTPQANREWWVAKLAQNRDRDLNANARLSELGWLPIRVWEHEDVQVRATEIADQISARSPARH